jgi:hypothetical protein
MISRLVFLEENESSMRETSKFPFYTSSFPLRRLLVLEPFYDIPF